MPTVHKPAHSPVASHAGSSAGPRPATAADLQQIHAAVAQLQKLPMGKEALRVDGRGMQMFQAGTKIYIHDTRKDRWYVSDGHAAPKAPAAAPSRPTGHATHDAFTHSVAGAVTGMVHEDSRNAIGIGLAGGAMNVLMGAASLFGG